MARHAMSRNAFLVPFGARGGHFSLGAKPAELPVLQSIKFEFVINLQKARALGLEVPNAIQLLAHARIRSFQILIPPFLFGDFFNTIGTKLRM